MNNENGFDEKKCFHNEKQSEKEAEQRDLYTDEELQDDEGFLRNCGKNTDNESDSCFTADTCDAGQRIDKIVSEKTGLSRTAAAKMLEDGKILVNSACAGKNYKIKSGDILTVFYPPVKCCDILPENIALDIVYEDGDIVVVNKPSGMVVHPAPGIYSGTLVNALLYHCQGSLSGIGGVARPGIVHRIDKDTSGLLVVAKNDFSHNILAEQIKAHKVERTYHAIALGGFAADSGAVDRPIGRHPADRKKMAVISDPQKKSRDAITHFSVIERFSLLGESLTYIMCKLETGRTHQIRVHMSYIGHPLLGDIVYGRVKSRFQSCNSELINGQCLHAKELVLMHPRTLQIMNFETPLPRDMNLLLDKLRRSSMQ